MSDVDTVLGVTFVAVAVPVLPDAAGVGLGQPPDADGDDVEVDFDELQATSDAAATARLTASTPPRRLKAPRLLTRCDKAELRFAKTRPDGSPDLSTLADPPERCLSGPPSSGRRYILAMSFSTLSSTARNGSLHSTVR
jgi:hypothetical protein